MFVQRVCFVQGKKKTLKNLVQRLCVQKTFWLLYHPPGYSLLTYRRQQYIKTSYKHFDKK